MEEKAIRPFYHDHPLFLKENENVSEDERVYCYGCRNPIGVLEMAYVCMKHDCSSQNRGIVLHKKCGEVPSEIRHHKHPDHPLHLVDFHQLKSHLCNVCRRRLDRMLGYRCSSCDFDVDIACEKIVTHDLIEERKELRHLSHPHPLTLIRKAVAFYCDGCGVQDVDMPYMCTICEFLVHKRCALLPTILPTDHHHHHHHRLSLAFSFPKEHRKYDYKCGVCDKYIRMACWVYFCGDCRYFVHIKCVGSTAKSDSNLIEQDDGGGGSGVIRFPLYANEIFDKLIKPFVTREKIEGVDKIPIPIPDTTTTDSFPFKYHEHSLSLVSQGEAAADDELKICNVCVTPISSPPYYHCPASACNYFIHSICCFLPNTLHSSSQLYSNCQNIPNKNHNFTFYAPTSKSNARDSISFWYCNLCSVSTNGMGYKCEECGVKIDVKCASLPTTIKHASHPHHKPKPLLLTTMPPPQEEDGTRKECHGCYDDEFDIGYCCSEDGCDFALDVRCALLPKSIREREWDKHPLLLTFDASRDHPSDFFCEFCEEEMHPKRWMYHCRQCDASFHLHCLETGSGYYRNMKFGRRYELDGIHPNHPLTFTYITLKKRCDVCHLRSVYTYVGLECASCYYVVCTSCGCIELGKNI